MSNKHYKLLIQQAEALLANEYDPIANAANLASLIYHNVQDLNWAGFYLSRDNELVLGPFCGQIACTRIVIGNGVCGTAYEKRETLIVDDVEAFDGHIVCDVASQSEIVVPFFGQVMSGVLDVDSPHKTRFSAPERDLFEHLVKLYQASIH